MSEITIGMPVYNGAETIEEALSSLLEGSFKDIRIIVSDNGSKDKTADIVEKVATRDARVMLHRQGKNLGPVGNFRFVAEKATSPYFAWRAHDDISNEDYLSVLLAALKDNPNAAFVAPHTITAKAKGNRYRPFRPSLKPGQVAGWQALNMAEAGWFYGLYRTDVAQKAVKFTDETYPHVWGWDYVVILVALLEGGAVGCNEAEFTHRILGPSTDAYAFSKARLRQIASDFYKVGMKAFEGSTLSLLQRQQFKIKLLRLILTRVIRLNRLIF